MLYISFFHEFYKPWTPHRTPAVIKSQKCTYIAKITTKAQVYLLCFHNSAEPYQHLNDKEITGFDSSRLLTVVMSAECYLEHQLHPHQYLSEQTVNFVLALSHLRTAVDKM